MHKLNLNPDLDFKKLSHSLNQQHKESIFERWSFGSNTGLRHASLLNLDYRQGRKRPILKKQLNPLAQDHPLVKRARQHCYPNDVYLF
ncbi:MAG: hypothetical protein HRU20_20380 [Pseudomonadales bacterium]|nr:hypothetical protein [Pseudomonadales bacterium]